MFILNFRKLRERVQLRVPKWNIFTATKGKMKNTEKKKLNKHVSL